MQLQEVLAEVASFHFRKASFCYKGAGGAPKTTFAPLNGVPSKFFKKRIIETIAYCFKNNDLLSFGPVKFFSSRMAERYSQSSFLNRSKKDDKTKFFIHLPT